MRAFAALVTTLLAVIVACGDSPSNEETSTPLLGACIADCSAIPTPQCFTSQCNPTSGQCEIVPLDGDECDDGLFCTVNDRCQVGKCTGDHNDCGLTAPGCKSVACDEPTRLCRFVAQPDGTSCASGDVCGASATCAGGTCVSEPKTCRYEPAPDECHVAACNPETGACDVFVPGNEGLPCTSDPCRVLTTCRDGVCQGGVVRDCRPWADDCHKAACDTAHAGCYGIPANEGQACSTHDACNVGACNVSGACVMTATADGAACSDGLSCTAGDTCVGGKCIGSGGPTTYLRDSFASNAQGWTTEGTWMIGPTRSVNSYPFSSCKPDLDHTRFGDKGVAATALGGLEGVTVHDFTYLTSPATDTSAASTLVLQFSYILEWLSPPLQEAVVDVWNGTAWIRVWQQLGRPPECIDEMWEPVWQTQTIDVAAHKSSGMRVRFGLAAHVPQLLAGWTLDDVALLSAPCP